jgi:hypothetical protein
VVECRGPKSLGTDLVCELVDGDAKPFEACPSLIESSFAAVLCLIPGGHDDAVEVKLELGKEGGLMMRLEMEIEMGVVRGLDSIIYTCR